MVGRMLAGTSRNMLLCVFAIRLRRRRREIDRTYNRIVGVQTIISVALLIAYSVDSRSSP
jgi:hypothetical protein